MLFAVTQAILLEVKAFAESGVVKVEDAYEFIAEAFLKGAFSDAKFEVSAGLVQVSNEIKGAGEEALFGSWNPGGVKVSR